MEAVVEKKKKGKGKKKGPAKKQVLPNPGWCLLCVKVRVKHKPTN